MNTQRCRKAIERKQWQEEACTRKTPLIQHAAKTQKKLNFQVQQVAFDLVVDIRVIFLLAQVQARDVHCRL